LLAAAAVAWGDRAALVADAQPAVLPVAIPAVLPVLRLQSGTLSSGKMSRGRYTIVGKLANGGMAEIFLARQFGAEGFQKPVVLKRVLSAFSADPQFRNMFIDEAHISMGLSHGNIVQVLDVGLSGERMFLVLELVEGWDLDQVIGRAQGLGADHPWPPSLALFVAAQICRALAYAHARRGSDGRPLGIIHRDVSPTNILISEQGEVKLTDFGIAKAARKREQTAAGVIKGKIGFMSPEQALGRVLDPRADLFSLGTVMYLMLTGRKPFEASTDLEALTRAQKADYRPPEQLNPYLPRNTTAILNRAMHREVGDRYQTADEMLLDLEKVLRTQYHSAGQSELKRWLAELARRDGRLPISRARETEAEHAPSDGAVQSIGSEGMGELSAGSSLELSDMSAQAMQGAVEPSPPGAGTVADPRRRGIDMPPPRPGGAMMAGASVPERAAPGTGASPRDEFAPTAALAKGAQPPPAALEPIAPSPVRLPPAGVSATRRFWRKSRHGVGFVVGALCMLGAVVAIRWLAHWAGQEVPPPGAASLRAASAVTHAAGGEAPRSPEKQARIDAGAIAVEAALRSSVDAAVAATAAREGARDGEAVGVAAPPRAAAEEPGMSAAAEESADEDEAQLLDRAVAVPATVIGEDDAEDAAAPGAGKSGAPARSGPGGKKAVGPTNPRARDKHGLHAGSVARSADGSARPVLVRITSSPPGAVIRTKNRVLGRTPLAIRFNPGSTYRLTFVKSGYTTTSRPVTVQAGKPGNVTVAMKKKAAAAPAAHGFFRGR
jgi:serine/threonine protein kinase